MKKSQTKPKLAVRNATLRDIQAIVDLTNRVYKDGMGLTSDMVRGQLQHFPEGQLVAEFEGNVVGYCATFIIGGEAALKLHTWREITGGGFASRHNPKGDYLYGMEVCVDEKARGLRIGQRLYDARKSLCQELGLKGIIFGGRMPHFIKRKSKYPDAASYLQAVKEKHIKDPVINFQMNNGFEVIGLLPGYLRGDAESGGYAVHMLWQNPLLPDTSGGTAAQRGRMQGSVRVATVQFQVRKVSSIDEFEAQLCYFVDVAADYRADFICFPELLTIPLLSIANSPIPPEKAIFEVANYTERYLKFMQELAISKNINIIGGTHPTRTEEEEIHNISYVFLRDGSVHQQEKIHPTPNERRWWNIKGGNKLDAIMTDCGPIGVLICYDSEFPELARYLADQGALILFVPFCTDERQGYLRVRYCCHARAVENQFYVVTSGVVGNLPNVENMDIHYAESCILTPCDFPFARDGIAAITAPNTEMIAFADLNMESLIMARHSGTVQNLKDRRFDLYQMEWTGE